MCERTVSSALVAYSVITKGGYGKADGGWKEVMQKVHAKTPGSQMDKISSFW